MQVYTRKPAAIARRRSSVMQRAQFSPLTNLARSSWGGRSPWWPLWDRRSLCNGCEGALPDNVLPHSLPLYQAHSQAKLNTKGCGNCLGLEIVVPQWSSEPLWPFFSVWGKSSPERLHQSRKRGHSQAHKGISQHPLAGGQTWHQAGGWPLFKRWIDKTKPK